MMGNYSYQLVILSNIFALIYCKEILFEIIRINEVGIEYNKVNYNTSLKILKKIINNRLISIFQEKKECYYGSNEKTCGIYP